LKISIITICYNNEADIRQTIESVMTQQYEVIEYIVVDGNSSDNTMNIVREYSDNINTIISEPDEGMYDAINKGIRHSTGDVVGLIHAGDRLFDDSVAGKIAQHFSVNGIDAMYGHSILVDKDDRPFRVNKSPEYQENLMKRGWMPSHQSVYIRRDKLSELGLYRLDLGGSADYEFVLRYFYLNNLKIKRLDDFIVRFAIGGRSTTNYRSTFLLSQKRHIQAWKINGKKPPFYFIPLKLGRKVKQFILAAMYRLNKSENEVKT
jgi:glycosyltransferase involved in cell wall biosynthesis